MGSKADPACPAIETFPPLSGNLGWFSLPLALKTSG